MRDQNPLTAICLWALLLSIFGSLPASAAVYTVTSTADSGTGSLRAALALATSGSDTINFGLTYPATITLTSDELSSLLQCDDHRARPLQISYHQRRRQFPGV